MTKQELLDLQEQNTILWKMVNTLSHAAHVLHFFCREKVTKTIRILRTVGIYVSDAFGAVCFDLPRLALMLTVNV